jgi:hypothetical protein
MISRSLQVPGSPSSALTTRYRGLPSAQTLHNLISNPPVVLLPSWLVHETPLQSRRKSSTSSSPQPRLLDLINQPSIPLQQNLLRLVPITPTLSPLQSVIMLHVQIGEYTILILQATVSPNGGIGDRGQRSGSDGHLPRQG